LLLAWHYSSGRRGKDLLRLTWEQVKVAGSEQLVATAWAEGQAVEGLLVCPQQTKSSGTSRPFTVEFKRGSDAEACPVTALYRWWKYATGAGEATDREGPLFCSYATTAVPAGGRRVLTAAGYGNQFKALGQKAGVPGTAHGIRRGRLQDGEEAGQAEAELRGLADMKRVETLRIYLDRGRHLPVYGARKE
jgi:hypothetical protein